MNLKSILSECWTGYKQVGMKNKGGRQVPNCVPESMNESTTKKDIEKLTSYKDLFKFFKDNKSKLNKKYTDDIEGEIGALKYLESDYKRGDADREEVLVAIEEIQDLIKKSLDIKEFELKESVINEDTRRVKLLGIDFNISEMNGRIFFSFIDKKAATIKIREIGTNKIVNLIQNSLDKAYGKGEFFFKGGDHAEFQNGYLFQRSIGNIKLNKLKFESVNEETYKVAGRPVTLIKGKKSNGTDWKVKFQNGKETSLIDVIALIKPFPKDIKITESELKGYLAADVVDDIVKAIGSKMVKGHVENAPNRNYIYLKLTDIKFGNDVVKMLKSKFGIDAKVDKTFGNIPTVSFASKKVISEVQAVSGGKVHKLITGKNLKFKGKSYNQIDFETLGVDNNNGTIRLKIIAPKEIFGNEMSLDFRTIRRGPFFKTDTSNQLSEGLYYVGYNKGRGQGTGVFKDSYSSYKDAKKEVEKIEKQRGGSYQQIAYYVADKDGNFVRESVTEEKVYIDFLNKAKGFKQDRVKFNSYEDAVKWARKNFEKFSPDMIKFESVNELSSNVPKIFVKTAAVEKKIKELMADRKRAVIPYNNETDPKKKEILKQILIKLTSQIKGYEKNLIQLRDMEEEYIQQMNANAELEVESKN